MSKTALGQGEVWERSIPALAQGLRSTYVRREKRKNKRPRRRANAPGPGTEGTSLRCERDGTDVDRSGIASRARPPRCPTLPRRSRAKSSRCSRAPSFLPKRLKSAYLGCLRTPRCCPPRARAAGGRQNRAVKESMRPPLMQGLRSKRGAGNGHDAQWIQWSADACAEEGFRRSPIPAFISPPARAE